MSHKANPQQETQYGYHGKERNGTGRKRDGGGQGEKKANHSQKETQEEPFQIWVAHFSIADDKKNENDWVKSIQYKDRDVTEIHTLKLRPYN